MSDPTNRHITVAAAPRVVLGVIADLEAYPAWVDGVREVTVMERGDGPGASRARFVAEAAGLSDVYVLDYTWAVAADALGTVSWRLRESQVLEAMEGSYTLEAGADGTIVTYRLAVEPIASLPGFVRRQAERTVVSTALDALRARAEHLASPSARGGECPAGEDPSQPGEAPGVRSLHEEKEGLIDALLAAGAGGRGAAWARFGAAETGAGHDVSQPTAAPPADDEWERASPLGCGCGGCPAPGVCHVCPVCRAGRAWADAAPHTLASLADAADLVADGARAVARFLSQTAQQAGRNAGPQDEGNTP